MCGGKTETGVRRHSPEGVEVHAGTYISKATYEDGKVKVTVDDGTEVRQ